LTAHCFALRDSLAYVLNYALPRGDQFGGENAEFIDA
jgi:hypothetical protein